MTRTEIRWIAGIVLLIVALVVGGFVIKYYTADVRGKVAANEQIKSGNNRIVQYDHFFNLCAAIQSQEAQLDALYVELDQSTGKDAARVRANITGVMAQRQRSIFQYNADATKNYTSGQFRDSNLPYQINSETYTSGGTKTQCASF